MSESLSDNWNIGQPVVCNTPVSAYYSGHGTPIANLNPGTIATINYAVLSIKNRSLLFVCEFTDEAQPADSPHRIRRAPVHGDNIRMI